MFHIPGMKLKYYYIYFTADMIIRITKDSFIDMFHVDIIRLIKDKEGYSPLSALLYCFSMIDFMGALFSG